MFKIIFLTDLHISPPDEFPLGVDIRNNFLNCLKEIKDKHGDLLVLGGDICLKGPIPDTYKWVKNHVDTLSIPFLSISGNHDDSSMMAKEFGQEDDLKGDELFFTRDFDNRTFIYLDTSSGTVSATQLEWLKNQVAHIKDDRLYVFMHHPPCLGLVPHMDEKHFLQNHEEVLKILQSADRQVKVFCGHYHTDRILIHGKVEVYFTPSLYLQIKDHTKEFGVETYNPGYRIIQEEGDFFFTKVYYLEASRFH